MEMTMVLTVKAEGPIGPQALPEAFGRPAILAAAFQAVADTAGVQKVSLAVVQDGKVGHVSHRGDREEPLVDLIEAAVETVRNWEHGDLAGAVRAMDAALQELGWTGEQLRCRL